MKKVLLFAALAAVSTAAFAYKDGVYTGAGTGNGSTIEVQVTVTDGKIAKVETIKHGETEMIFAAVNKKLPKAIVKVNSTEGVHVITGASNSSKGFLEAVHQALDKAK